MSRPLRASDLGWAAALGLATVLLFLPALDLGFVNYDDPGYVTSNPVVTRGLHAEGIRWAFSAFVKSNWHPLTWLSHMLDVQWSGLDPAGHHATSVVLHALTAAGLFLLLLSLTGARWVALWTAALFAWHPTRVESVAWISERKDVLAGLFLVLILAAHLRRVRRPTRGAHLLVLLLTALGLMAKPMLVSVPALLLLLDAWPLRRWSPFGLGAEAGPGRAAGTRRLVSQTLPLLALVVASSLATLAAQSAGGALVDAGRLPLDERLQNAALSVVGYLRLLVWPADLAVHYPHRLPDGASAWLLACALLAVLSVLAFRLRRRHPAWLVGWLWFVGMLVPVIGIVQVGAQSMADRYTYLPFIGLGLALAHGGAALTAQRPAARRALASAGVLALLTCLPLTRAQLARWQDSESLFRHALQVTEGNALAHHQLGRALYDRGALREAGEQYAAALELQPGYVNALVNLGVVRQDLGDIAAAEAAWLRALETAPDDAMALGNLGTLRVEQGRVVEGVELLERAQRVAPQDPFVLNSLGAALARSGRPAQALPLLEQATRAAPDDPRIWRNRGLAHHGLGAWDEAARCLRQGLALGDAGPVPAHVLGLVLRESGRPREAREAFTEALRREPGFEPARAALAALDDG